VPEQPFAAETHGELAQNVIGAAEFQVDHPKFIALTAHRELPPVMVKLPAFGPDELVQSAAGQPRDVD
jgi:hypothetical protein